MNEPGTPVPVLKHGGREYPLAWTKRSEAMLSKHGHSISSLFKALRGRRTGWYALCLGIYAALPADVAPEDPLDVAEWLPDAKAQEDAFSGLLKVIRHAYPATAEKKSASKR
jgi:hypothetical protein